MGERIVADFEGYFGDVTSTASEQERSLFDAKGAEVEGESFTCFFGHEATQVVRRAADFAGKLFQINGFIEAGLYQLECLSDMAVGLVLELTAEKGVLGAAFLKKMSGEKLKNLGLIPRMSGKAGNGGRDQILEELFLATAPPAKYSHVLPEEGFGSSEEAGEGLRTNRENECGMTFDRTKAGGERRGLELFEIEQGHGVGEEGQSSMGCNHQPAARLIENQM